MTTVSKPTPKYQRLVLLVDVESDGCVLGDVSPCTALLQALVSEMASRASTVGPMHVLGDGCLACSVNAQVVTDEAQPGRLILLWRSDTPSLTDGVSIYEFENDDTTE